MERQHRLVRGERIIEPAQTLERAGAIFERREIAGVEANAFSKQASAC